MMRKVAKPLLFSAALIWGSTFVMIKDTLDSVPTFYLIAIRFTQGSGVLALACWKRWKQFTPDYLWRGAMAGCFLFLTYLLQTAGLTTTTPSKSAFFTAVYCVMVPFLAWGVAKVRPDRYHVVAAVLCVAGIGLVSLDERLTLNFGDLLTLLSAFFCACNIVVLPLLSRGKDISLLTVCQFTFTGLYAWVGGALTETFPAQALLNPEAYLPLLYLSVLATAVALLFQNVGMVWCNPTSAALLLSLESVFGVLFSILFYGDPVTVQLVLGFGLVFLAIVCSETKFSFLRKKLGGEALDL